jgi:hypothetical protein
MEKVSVISVVRRRKGSRGSAIECAGRRYDALHFASIDLDESIYHLLL